MRVRVWLIAVLVLALSVPAAAVEPGTHRRGGPGPLVRVRMLDDRFRPPAITVSAGTRIRWVNVGDDRHSSTSNTGLWESGLLEPGERFTRRFRSTGTFAYHCTIHPQMRGTVFVT